MSNVRLGSWIQELNNKISLVDHVSKYCDGRITGSGFQGDHGTKHESGKGQCLGVVDSINGEYWNCFNCDTGGDLVGFHADYHGINPREAAFELARMYSIPIPSDLVDKPLSPEEEKKFALKKQLNADSLAFMQEATQWYHEQALARDSVLNYYKGRGITTITIEELKLGYAPAGNQLYETFREKYELPAMLGTALICQKKNEDGTFNTYDFFRDRYLYPYWEDFKRTRCSYMIGGRTAELDQYGKELKKYTKLRTPSNYPEINPNVVKHIFWNQGALNDKEQKAILITEGIVDGILAHQTFKDTHTVISPVTAKISGANMGTLCDLITSGRLKNDITIVNDVEVNNTGKKRAYDNTVGIYDKCAELRGQKESQAYTEILKKDKNLSEADIKGRVEDREKAAEKGIKDKDLEKKIAAEIGYYKKPHVKIAILAKPPEMDKIDLANYLQRGLTEEALYFIENGKTKLQFEQYVEDDPARFFEYNPKQPNSNRFIESAMVAELRSEGFYASIGDGLYCYGQGIFRPDETEETKKVVIKKLKQKAKVTLVNTSIDHLKMLTSVDPNVELARQDTDILNVKNGLLNIGKMVNSYIAANDRITAIDRDSLTIDEYQQAVKEILATREEPELLPHDPFRVSFAQIPVEYNSDNKDKIINNFLLEVLSKDDVRELYKAVGYALMPTTEYDKAFLFHGDGGNGKSTALNIIMALIGEENCSVASLDELENDKYAPADLHGKLACVNADIESGYLPNTSTFKKLTGGDKIRAREIYQKPFSFKPYVTLFFSANQYPHTADTTNAVRRRWHFFAFDKTFEEGESTTDPDIESKLITDTTLSSLLNLAILGWIQLKIDKGFKDTKRSVEKMDEFVEMNSPVDVYANRFLQVVDTDPEPEHRITTTYLKKQFQAWYSAEYGTQKGCPKPAKIIGGIKSKFRIDTAKGVIVDGAGAKKSGRERFLNLMYQPGAEKELTEILGLQDKGGPVRTNVESEATRTDIEDIPL